MHTAFTTDLEIKPAIKTAQAIGIGAQLKFAFRAGLRRDFIKRRAQQGVGRITNKQCAVNIISITLMSMS